MEKQIAGMSNAVADTYDVAIAEAFNGWSCK
jgi:hypothetical protein